MLAFGSREGYNDEYLFYTGSIDMLLSDLKGMGYKDLTKEKLGDILENLSIGYAIKKEISRLLDE